MSRRDPLPDAIANLMAEAEELASALFHCAPDRAVTEEEVEKVAGFVTSTVLDQALEAIKTPFAAAMVTVSAERFKDELASRLAAKIGLRDMQPAGVA